MLLAGATVTLAHAQDTSSYRATHYGTSYQGQTMGCGGRYDTNDTTILAVPPSLYHIPCGTQFTVTGSAGSIHVTRQDSCPGCDRSTPSMIDLSEAGITIVCGSLGSCIVSMERVSNND